MLCATSADGSTVELVEPPEGSVVGERVSFEGHDMPPEETLPPKKKIWEKVSVARVRGAMRNHLLQSFILPGRRPLPSSHQVQPELNTSADCVARWNEIPFRTSAGVCTVASVSGGTIK